MLHITIIENGETKIDLDTKGIIAAIDNGDSTEGVSVIQKLSAGDILMMFRTLDEAKNGLIEKHPTLKLLTLLEQAEKQPDEKDSKMDRVVELLAEALEDEN